MNDKVLYTYNPAAMHSSNSSSPLTRCVYVRSPGGDKRLGLLFRMELPAKDKKPGKWVVSDEYIYMLVLLITHMLCDMTAKSDFTPLHQQPRINKSQELHMKANQISLIA